MNAEKIQEVVAVWEKMGRHLGEVSEHMVRNLAAQTTTEKAARQSAAAVKLAACGFLLILSVASFVIGTMVQASITVAASQRTGMLMRLEELEVALQRYGADCKRIASAPAPTPPEPLH